MDKTITGSMKIRQTSRYGSFLGKYWLLLVTIVLAIAFGVLRPAFFRPKNLLNILSSACLTGIAGLGITCISAAGETDFSIGAQVTFSATMMAVLLKMPIFHDQYLLVMLITLLLMVLFGSFNAFLHIYVGIPAFIATMGSSYLLNGLSKLILDMKTIRADPTWPSCFTFLGQTYLGGVLPVSLVILIVISVAMYLYTEKTYSGRFIFAVGANPDACRYMGIREQTQKFKGFILCALMGGLTGIITGSMQNGANPTMGDDMLFNAMSVLMLGSTFIKRGVYNVPGTILASVLMAIISYGMTMMGVPPFVRDFVKGGILVLSITIVTLLRAGRRAKIG